MATTYRISLLLPYPLTKKKKKKLKIKISENRRRIPDGTRLPVQHAVGYSLPPSWGGDGLRYTGHKRGAADGFRPVPVHDEAGDEVQRGEGVHQAHPASTQLRPLVVEPRDQDPDRPAHETCTRRGVHQGGAEGGGAREEGSDIIGRRDKLAPIVDAVGHRAEAPPRGARDPGDPRLAGRRPESAGSHSRGRHHIPHRLSDQHSAQPDGEHQLGPQIRHHRGRAVDGQRRPRDGRLHLDQVREQERRLARHRVHAHLLLGQLGWRHPREERARVDGRVLQRGVREHKQARRVQRVPHAAQAQVARFREAEVERPPRLPPHVSQLPHRPVRHRRVEGGGEGRHRVRPDEQHEEVRREVPQPPRPQLQAHTVVHGRVLELRDTPVHHDHLPHELHGQDGAADRPYGRRRSRAQGVRGERVEGDRRVHHAHHHQRKYKRACDNDRREGGGFG